MAKIDTKNWHSILIGDIFESKNTGNILARDVKNGSGTTPFVTASGINNGVAAYIDSSDYDLIKGNCILVGGKTFTLTYQEKDFVSNDSHNFVLRLKNAQNKYVYFYLIVALRASLKSKYSWGDAVTKDKISHEYILLPCDKNLNPDYSYMEKYMINMGKLSQQRVNTLSNIIKSNNSQNKHIDISTWRLFELGELFNIVKGTRLTKANMKDGDINYIGASSFNNGITYHIGNKEHLHPAGTLTVCYNGSVGTTFYQPSPFWATDDVNVLYPKFKMHPLIALFIAPLIEKAGQNYAYTDKWQLETMKKTSIPLPVDEEGKPDWKRIKDYMKQLDERVMVNLKNLKYL